MARSVHACEPTTGLRLRNPLLDGKYLSDSLKLRKVRTFAQLKAMNRNDVEHIDTCGVLVYKSGMKRGSKGGEYSVWRLSDLDYNTVTLIISDECHKKFHSQDLGSVLLLLAVDVKEERESSRGGDDAMLCVSAHMETQVVPLGASMDYGVCRGTKADNTRCRIAVNVSRCPFCKYHLPKDAGAHARAQKARLQGRLANAAAGLTGVHTSAMPATRYVAPAPTVQRKNTAQLAFGSRFGAAAISYGGTSRGAMLGAPASGRNGPTLGRGSNTTLASRGRFGSSSATPSLAASIAASASAKRTDVAGDKRKRAQQQSVATAKRQAVGARAAEDRQSTGDALGDLLAPVARAGEARSSSSAASNASATRTATTAMGAAARHTTRRPASNRGAYSRPAFDDDMYHDVEESDTAEPLYDGSVQVPKESRLYHDVAEKFKHRNQGLGATKVARNASTEDHATARQREMREEQKKIAELVRKGRALKAKDPNSVGTRSSSLPVSMLGSKHRNSQGPGAGVSRGGLGVGGRRGMGTSGAGGRGKGGGGVLGALAKALGGVKADEVVKAKSRHANAAAEVGYADVQTHLDKLAYRDDMEAEKERIREMTVKAYMCCNCNTVTEWPLGGCKLSNHKIKCINTRKRFFECDKCGERTSALGKGLPAPCERCNGGMWRRCGAGRRQYGSGQGSSRVVSLAEHTTDRQRNDFLAKQNMDVY